MHISEDNHHIICLDFKFHKLYIVWIGGEIDEVLVNNDLKIIGFKSEEDLMDYWQKHIKGKNTKPAFYGIYKLQQWLIKPYPKFDFDEFLNFWNLFTDVSESTKLKFIGDERNEVTNEIYDKLFNASDVLIADEPNPTFSTEEIDMLNKVMKKGIDLLLNNLVIIEDEKILP